MKSGLASSLLVAATATLALAACGVDESVEPRSTLDYWRVAACEVLRAHGDALEPPATDGDDPSLGSGDDVRRVIVSGNVS